MEQDSNYCLWLNGKRIYDSTEINDNFDLRSLRGYFLGGSLIKWLRLNSGEKLADYLNDISISDLTNINGILEYAFGKRETPPEPIISEENAYAQSNILYSENRSPISSAFSSGFIPSGFKYYANSFVKISSVTLHSYLNEGSRSINSVSSSSWYMNVGSGKIILGLKSFYDFLGSFTGIKICNQPPAAEECPLNKFGYGIHLI